MTTATLACNCVLLDYVTIPLSLRQQIWHDHPAHHPVACFSPIQSHKAAHLKLDRVAIALQPQESCH
jgi:hypothetical protein